MRALFVVLPLRRIAVWCAAGMLLAAGVAGSLRLDAGRTVSDGFEPPSPGWEMRDSPTPQDLSSAPVFLMDEPLPPFVLRRADGSEADRELWRDKPLVLVFWAGWCTVCLDGLHTVAKVHQEHQLEARVHALAVNVADSPDTVASFTSIRTSEFSQLFDPDGEAAAALQIGLLPAIVIVDEYGIVRDRMFGPIVSEVYAARILALVPDTVSDGAPDPHGSDR